MLHPDSIDEFVSVYADAIRSDTQEVRDLILNHLAEEGALPLSAEHAEILARARAEKPVVEPPAAIPDAPVVTMVEKARALAAARAAEEKRSFVFEGRRFTRVFELPADPREKARIMSRAILATPADTQTKITLLLQTINWLRRKKS